MYTCFLKYIKNGTIVDKTINCQELKSNFSSIVVKIGISVRFDCGSIVPNCELNCVRNSSVVLTSSAGIPFLKKVGIISDNYEI